MEKYNLKVCFQMNSHPSRSAIEMTETETTEKKPIVLPCIAAVLSIASLFLIGQAGPAFSEMYKDFGVDALPWNIQFISCFHFLWTLPLGCLVAGVLLWGSRRWTRRRSLLVAGLAAGLAVVCFFVFVFISMMPIFHMSS